MCWQELPTCGHELHADLNICSLPRVPGRVIYIHLSLFQQNQHRWPVQFPPLLPQLFLFLPCFPDLNFSRPSHWYIQTLLKMHFYNKTPPVTQEKGETFSLSVLSVKERISEPSSLAFCCQLLPSPLSSLYKNILILNLRDHSYDQLYNYNEHSASHTLCWNDKNLYIENK